MPFIASLGAGSVRGFGEFTTLLTLPPSNFVVATTNSSQIALTWTSGDATANTQVFRDTSLVTTLNAGVTSYNDTGRTSATTYAYIVRHIKNAIPSVNSSSISNTTSITAPSSLTVTTVNTSQINLAWTNGDSGANVEIYRDGALLVTLASGVTSYGSASLSSATTYAYVVRHLKNAVTSANTGSVSNTTTLSVPTSLSATIPSDTQVNLSWTNTDAGANTQIFRNGVNIANTNVGVNSFSDTGRTPATNYTYVVRHRKNSVTSSNTGSTVGRPVAFATGGSVVTSGGYRIHTFNSTASLSVSQPGTMEYLIVGGGGAGGSDGGGGGGGGGICVNTSYVSASTLATVGAGGAATTDGDSNHGGNGSDSSFNGDTGSGGGGGGGGASAGVTGGSGGGGGWLSGGPGSATGPIGNPGGTGAQGAGLGYPAAGGGGGSAAGQDGQFQQSGNGGAGYASSISGSSLTYSGGGGGYGDNGALVAGTGGTGGGAAGSERPGNNGGVNTGGGGGGINTVFSVSGAGGSGVVIVRYPV